MRTKKDILKELPKFQGTTTSTVGKCPPGPNGEPQIVLPNGQCGTFADLQRINATAGLNRAIASNQMVWKANEPESQEEFNKRKQVIDKMRKKMETSRLADNTRVVKPGIKLPEQVVNKDEWNPEYVKYLYDKPRELTALDYGLMALPAIVGAAVTAPAWAPAVGAALSAPMLGIPGLTASNLLWGTGAYLSGSELINPNSATRTSINQAVKNPTFDNVAGAIGTTGLTGLGFAGLPVRSGLLSLGDDFTRAGQYLTTQTPLRNAYKINPFAFKSNPEAYYRMLGKEGYADALESGIIRANPKRGKFEVPYFAKGKPSEVYAGPYMAEYTADDVILPKYNISDYATPLQTITVGNPNLKFYKQDWLRGYKEVPKPATISNPITNITQKDIQGALINILKEQKPSWFIEEPPKTASTDIIDQINASNFLKEILKNPNKQALYTPVSNRVVLGLNPPLEGGRQIRLVDEGAGLFKQKADELGEGYNLYDLLHQTQYHIRKNKYGGKINYLRGYKK